MFVSKGLKSLEPLVRQAELLAAQYGSVVANPPYMRSKFHVNVLAYWLKQDYEIAKDDLFSAFIVRFLGLTKSGGFAGAMTPFSWMFLSSHQDIRHKIYSEYTLTSLIQLHYDAYSDAKAHPCTFVVRSNYLAGFRSSFVRLADFAGSDVQSPRTLEAIRNKDCGWFYCSSVDDFRKVPGEPIAYWLAPDIAALFRTQPKLEEMIELNAGLSTGNNEVFQRQWHEVSLNSLTLNYLKIPNTWVPCNSGGRYRKWFGNNGIILNWKDSGAKMRNYRNAMGKIASAIRNEGNYFRTGLTWTKLSSARFSARWMDEGFAFDDTGRSGFVLDSAKNNNFLLAAMLSNASHAALEALAPTASFTSTELAMLPIPEEIDPKISELASKAIAVSRWDWDIFERSWVFSGSPLLFEKSKNLQTSYNLLMEHYYREATELRNCEIQINELINKLLDIKSISPEVPIEQITLTVNPAYRYGGSLSEDELWNRFRQDTIKELLSYAPTTSKVVRPVRPIHQGANHE
jgi:type II restriction/modification system DNA methylase subunit YeeA